MSTHLNFRPDLANCVLEERYLPAIPNLGMIILTTSGYILITPFPGATSAVGGSLGSAGPASGGTAASVSGTAIPTGMYLTGMYGISSMRPGNITGIAVLATNGGAGQGTGNGGEIQVGSGADEAGGPTIVVARGGATNNVVSRMSFADPTIQNRFQLIGGISLSNTGQGQMQSYQDPAPVQAPGTPGPAPDDSEPTNTKPTMPDPREGQPRLGPMRIRELVGPHSSGSASGRAMPTGPAPQ